jgi:ABC-type multidrug transport system fused ATPase/permease subunit
VLRGIRTASLRSQRAMGDMTSDLERALSAIRTVRANRGEERETRRIGRHAESVYRSSVRIAKLDALIGPAGQMAVNGSFLVILIVGGLRVADGSSSLGDLIAFMLYMTYLSVPIGNAFQAMSAIQQGTGALQRINDVLALPREPVTAAVTDAHRAPSPRSTGLDREPPTLELRDLWFGYEPGRPVLRGVSLRVQPRSHTALIGPSGAGKSTIVALVERFHEPDRGHIMLNGIDVATLTREQCRAAVGLVEQDCPVLDGTLRDNIAYSAPHAADADIARAVQLANLTELVTRLPHGLDSEVGEHGDKVSGGERQRIAIARSLLAGRSPRAAATGRADRPPRQRRRARAESLHRPGLQGVRAAGHRPPTLNHPKRRADRRHGGRHGRRRRQAPRATRYKRVLPRHRR